ncbi:MAG: IS66 family transposase [Methylococcales bacterium]
MIKTPDDSEHKPKLFGNRMTAVEPARGSPPDVPLTQTWQAQLADNRFLCEPTQTVLHKPTRDLANEMLNDWEAILRVLWHPELPLTNNESERALRHGRSSCAKFGTAPVQKTAHVFSPS